MDAHDSLWYIPYYRNISLVDEAPLVVPIMKIPRHAPQYAVAFVLLVMVIAVFWQVRDHSFIGFDDPRYIIDNPYVRAGLTKESVSWAFTTFHASNWHPLTWMSHMLDVELFGLDAGWHHRVNVLFHLANTLLLFLVFRRMTEGVWQSAFVAALFAVHPLHVESVAWVSERKDVLSTLFWFLTMGAYLRYARKPGVRRYLLVAFCFSMGLMCKPILVTLPFVLFLLDWWPLRRFDGGPSPLREASRLLTEKIPLLVLSAASSAVTYMAQSHGGAVNPQEYVSVGMRISNAAVSYAVYLRKTVWPASLAVFYPHPVSVGAKIPVWHTAGAVLLLGAVSFLALREGRRRPFIAVGWLWFLGTLVPVIGLVPVGAQALADRYTYVPLIGIFMAVAWGIPDGLRGWRFRKPVMGVSAGVLLASLSMAAWVQTGYWRDSISLFTRAIRVTEKNWLASYNLAVAYDETGQTRQAVTHFREALGIRPYDYQAWSRLGKAYGKLGEYRQAIASYEEAVRFKKDDADAWSGLGAAYLYLGRPGEAIPYFREAVGIRPDFVKAWSDLGVAYLELGEYRQAITRFREALRFDLDQAPIWSNLGSAYLEAGRPDQAIPCFREALRIKPDHANALYNLGLAYSRLGQRKEMMEAYRLLRQVDPEKAGTFLDRHGMVQ
jgi:tetratricopeptide (TPR) repeat protein